MEAQQQTASKEYKTGVMDTLSLYLVLLLSGIIIGGAIVAIVLLPMAQARQYGYRPPVYADGYDYAPYPPRRAAALPATLLFFLLLLAAIFLARQQRQELPVVKPDAVEHTSVYHDTDSLYKP